ncbi:hypothetical protein DAEQUDRAFT_162901 [Daedalea quercina L-15889]|uniref:Uncharacterized protein n=1 Tax=Daedalea quercina L-15889 TaxID=1314783 RepID=A0A165RGC6_9APHY|nr:hypothetical protein DAEQUDRAFT_162901 [Daedalea quercina L-15889]
MSPSYHLLVLPPRLNTCLWTKHMTSAVTSLACQVDIAWVLYLHRTQRGGKPNFSIAVLRLFSIYMPSTHLTFLVLWDIMMTIMRILSWSVAHHF